jgi:hypothetical protein
MTEAAVEDLFTFAAIEEMVAEMPDGVPVDVCLLFEKLALEVRALGFERYSARAIIHRIRWHEQIDKGNREFKCNNNWTPSMARWVIAKHPNMTEFFELRESPNR